MQKMKLDIWGVRGTHPVSDPKKIRYGGNTMCSSLMISGQEILIIDAVTGIIELGRRLADRDPNRKLRIHLLLTHFHLDHIMGLPFFPALHSPHASITFYSAVPARETERCLDGLMSGKYYPLEFGKTPSVKEFRSLAGERLTVGDVEITACGLHHPQGSVSYRLDSPEGSFILATDTEVPENEIDEAFADFSRGADVLIHDAMFTPEEYPARKGWGHSTWRGAVRTAEAAKVGSLYLAHFNPAHNDERVDELVRSAREHFPQTFAAEENRRGVTLET